MDTCKSCRFWYKSKKECRRNPPTVTSFRIVPELGAVYYARDTAWPYAEGFHCCGQHEPNPTPLAAALDAAGNPIYSDDESGTPGSTNPGPVFHPKLDFRLTEIHDAEVPGVLVVLLVHTGFSGIVAKTIILPALPAPGSIVWICYDRSGKEDVYMRYMVEDRGAEYVEGMHRVMVYCKPLNTKAESNDLWNELIGAGWDEWLEPGSGF